MNFLRTAFEVGLGWFGAQLAMGLCFIIVVGICFGIYAITEWISRKFKN